MKKNFIQSFILVLIGLVFFGAAFVKQEIFADYRIYQASFLHAYEKYFTFSDPANFTKPEPGLQILFSLLGLIVRISSFDDIIFDNIQLLFFSLSFAFVGFTGYKLTNNRNPCIFFLSCFSYLFISRNIYTLRSAIAYSLFILGFCFYTSYKKHLIIFISALFHFTVIPLYLFFVLSSFTLNKHKFHESLFRLFLYIAIPFGLVLILARYYPPLLSLFISGRGDTSTYLSTPHLRDSIISSVSALLGVYICYVYKPRTWPLHTLKSSLLVLLLFSAFLSPFYYQLSSRLATIGFLFSPFLLNNALFKRSAVSISFVVLALTFIPTVRMALLLSSNLYAK